MTATHPEVAQFAPLRTCDVRCLDGHVVVDGLVLHEPTVVDYFAAMEPSHRTEAARRGFELGVRALAAAGGSATMAALDDRLNDAVSNANAALAGAARKAEEQMQALCARYLGESGEFTQRLEKDLNCVDSTLAPDGSVVKQMREAIAGEVRQSVLAALEPVRAALNVNDVDGPLGLMQQNLAQLRAGQLQIGELVQGARRLQAERQRSVHKGYDLEHFIKQILGDSASRLGDRFDDCSLTAGYIPNCKAGDFVSLLDPQFARNGEIAVAIEAKNGQSETVASLCKAVDEAKANRGAVVGIGVVTNPSLTCAPIAFSGPDTIVVHLSGFGNAEADEREHATLLRLAYYTARMQAVALGAAGAGRSLDSAVVEEHLDRLAAAVAKFSLLRRNLTGIESAVEKTRACADLIRSEIDGVAEELRDTLSHSALE